MALMTAHMAPFRSLRSRTRASGLRSASNQSHSATAQPDFIGPLMATMRVAALFVSMMPQMAFAETAPVRQLNGDSFDRLSSVLCIAEIDCAGSVAEAGSDRAKGLKKENAGGRNASRPVYVAEETVKSAPKAFKGGVLRRGSTEHRRTDTRKPVDPVPSAQCLATGTCTKPAQPDKGGRPGSDNPNPVQRPRTNSLGGLERSPFADGAQSGPALAAPNCAASAELKQISPALRQKLLTLSGSQNATDCTRAVAKLSPLREQLRYAYENALPEDLSEHFTKAATDYIHSCLGDNMLLDQGALTLTEEGFLRAHTGFIVQRISAAPQDTQPICEAARLGKLVVTAQHCVPMNSSSHNDGGGYARAIAFRFLDQATNYDVVPRLFNDTADRSLDYAILEIVGAPELREKIEPLVGKMELFSDFYDLTANMYLRVVNKQTGDTAVDLRRATLFEHSTLCRPAYIATNGLFLHACQTEAGLSGTPLFQRQNGRLVFVGIHNGVTEALEDPSLAACAHGLPNYGVSIPPSALMGIQSR